MNCLFNGKIKDLKLFKKIHIPFAPDDSGNSIGSAIKVSQDCGFKLKKQKFDSCLGYEENIDYLKKFKNYGLNFKILDKKVNYIAEQISKNKVIAYFSGKAEFGQRALGNRSILASPVRKDMKNIINKKLSLEKIIDLSHHY